MRLETAQLATAAPAFFPAFLTIEEAVCYSGLSKATITNALHAVHPLPHFKNGRLYQIHRDSINGYFRAMCVGDA
jgi:excisionase family DNA binding protein